MDAASREQAKQVFLSKGVPPGRRIEYAKDIDRYMRPVHVITKTAGPNNRPPAKVYTFWRMPLYHSEEYRLIKEGRLPDFIDANRRKMSPPFKIDPTKGVIDNLIAAYGITSPFLRKGGRTISIAAAQWLHVALGIVRTAGDVAQWGLHWPEVDAKLQKIGFPPGLLSMNPETRNFIEDLSKLGTNEKHLQWIDEYLGSASFAPLSQLYKVPKNSNNYKQAVEISMKSGEKINLKRNEKTGNDWDWEEILIDTGRVDDKGQKIYLGGIDPVTKKPIPQGRLNLHLYPGKRP